MTLMRRGILLVPARTACRMQGLPVLLKNPTCVRRYTANLRLRKVLHMNAECPGLEVPSFARAEPRHAVELFAILAGSKPVRISRQGAV